MKYLYLVLLLLPLKVLGQVKLQDVTINSKQPKFVRLKGYFVFPSYTHFIFSQAQGNSTDRSE